MRCLHLTLRANVAVSLALALLFSATAQGRAQATGHAAAEVAENSGQDPANPVRRLDLRLQYQQINEDSNAWIFTPRVDAPFQLGGGWRLSTRIDLPIITNNVPSLDNPDGDWDEGLADVLTQFLFIKRFGSNALILGSQVIFPTASQDQFGTGKLRLVPTAGVVHYPGFLPPGSFIGGIGRYDFDIAGDSDRDDISVISLQPLLNVALPDRWFVTFAPEVRIDPQDGDIFLPFDMTVGRKITPATVASLEFKHKIIDDLVSYDWSLEARIGFFF